MGNASGDTGNEVVVKAFFSSQATLSVLIIIGVLFLVFYVLTAAATYIMADKRGLKSKWFAFIPFLRFYLIGELAGSIRLGAKTFKNFALPFFFITFATIAVDIISNVLMFHEIIGYIFKNGGVSFTIENNQIDLSMILSEHGKKLYEVGYFISIVSYILRIFSVAISAMVYAALYKGYCPRRSVLLTVFSVIGMLVPPLGLEGVCLMIVRNNEFGDYNEYIKKKYQAYQQTYRQQNPYGQNPYGQPQQPYGQDPFGQPQQPYGQQDPFGESQNPFDGDKAEETNPFGEPQQNNETPFDMGDSDVKSADNPFGEDNSFTDSESSDDDIF